MYSDITLPSGDMGTIKVERIDDDKKDRMIIAYPSLIM